jgi:hypothetical protein
MRRRLRAAHQRRIAAGEALEITAFLSKRFPAATPHPKKIRSHPPAPARQDTPFPAESQAYAMDQHVLSPERTSTMLASPHCVRSVPSRNTSDSYCVPAGTDQNVFSLTVEVIRIHFIQPCRGLRVCTRSLVMTRRTWTYAIRGREHSVDAERTALPMAFTPSHLADRQANRSAHVDKNQTLASTV